MQTLFCHNFPSLHISYNACQRNLSKFKGLLQIAGNQVFHLLHNSYLNSNYQKFYIHNENDSSLCFYDILIITLPPLYLSFTLHKLSIFRYNRKKAVIKPYSFMDTIQLCNVSVLDNQNAFSFEFLYPSEIIANWLLSIIIYNHSGAFRRDLVKCS